MKSKLDLNLCSWPEHLEQIWLQFFGLTNLDKIVIFLTDVCNFKINEKKGEHEHFDVAPENSKHVSQIEYAIGAILWKCPLFFQEITESSSEEKCS